MVIQPYMLAVAVAAGIAIGAGGVYVVQPASSGGATVVVATSKRPYSVDQLRANNAAIAKVEDAACNAGKYDAEPWRDSYCMDAGTAVVSAEAQQRLQSIMSAAKNGG